VLLPVLYSWRWNRSGNFSRNWASSRRNFVFMDQDLWDKILTEVYLFLASQAEVVVVVVTVVVRWHFSTANDFAFSCRFLHGVVCRLSHSCTLWELFDGFRCYLAGSLVGLVGEVQWHLVSDGVSLTCRGKRFGGWNQHSPNLHLPTLWFTRGQHWLEFYVLPNYFGQLLLLLP